ncbi:hypothetical protein PSTT_00752 [Puccinia striiformis]|uniref:FHA domain-containing protein n=1 Tax=Puccinia striiformis TaxID=27350 RepID=A0A2S4W6E1_9BASI|nr:hypothetical protein PSTT_00752 [Puccinia striiformis]
MGLESESQINLGHLPALTQATSAAIGSVISNAIVYPLDLVSLSFYKRGETTSSSRKNRPQNYDDLISSFKDHHIPIREPITVPITNLFFSKRTGIRRRSAGISGECTVAEHDGRLTESDSSSSSGEEDDEDRSRKESYFSHLSRTIRSIYEDRGYLGFCVVVDQSVFNNFHEFSNRFQLSTILTYPLMLSKTLLQTLPSSSSKDNDSLVARYRRFGIAALYTGLQPKLLKIKKTRKLRSRMVGNRIIGSISRPSILLHQLLKRNSGRSITYTRPNYYANPTHTPDCSVEPLSLQSRSLIEQGSRLLEKSDLEGALLKYEELTLEHLRLANQLDPTDPEICFNLGAVNEANGNLVDALAEYTRAKQLGVERAEQNIRNVSAKLLRKRLEEEEKKKTKKKQEYLSYTTHHQQQQRKQQRKLVLINRKSPVLRIPIEPGHCLVFGRKPDLRILSNEINNKSSTILPITLPKSFTHASRTHCLCTLIAPPLGGLNIRIVVKGQNGLMVDGERFEEGSAGVELERRDGEQIELGFYGGKKVECYVKIDDHLNTRVRSRPTTTTTTTSTTRAGKRKALSTTTIKTQKLKGNNHQPETQPAIESDQEQQPNKKICLSPIPSPPYNNNNNEQNNTIPTTEEGRNLTTEERIRRLIESMGLDLLGMIASAVVFSSRATVSTSEVIRSVLETQPSLAESILAILPSSSSSSSPDPTPLIDINPKLEDELEEHTGLSLSNRRTCASAPLPSTLSHSPTPTPTIDDLLHNDTKPFLSHYGSESGLLNPSPSPSLPHPINTTTTTTANTTSNNTNTVSEIERVVHFCKPIFIHTLKNHSKVNGTGMFGCVSNEGLKDASGEPLENLWYYQAQFDSDLERKLNLQPYVRHIRHTQTTSKQYFFKKVRGNGRRKS